MRRQLLVQLEPTVNGESPFCSGHVIGKQLDDRQTATKQSEVRVQMMKTEIGLTGNPTEDWPSRNTQSMICFLSLDTPSSWGIACLLDSRQTFCGRGKDPSIVLWFMIELKFFA